MRPEARPAVKSDVRTQWLESRPPDGGTTVTMPDEALTDRLVLRREAHRVWSIAFARDSEGLPLWQDAFTYTIFSDEWGERR